jgi:hypothetical protein
VFLFAGGFLMPQGETPKCVGSGRKCSKPSNNRASPKSRYLQIRSPAFIKKGRPPSRFGIYVPTWEGSRPSLFGAGEGSPAEKGLTFSQKPEKLPAPGQEPQSRKLFWFKKLS